MMIYETNSPEDTFRLEKRLAEMQSGGGVYSDGRSWRRKNSIYPGRGCRTWHSGPVNSPTFTILQIYEEGRLPLYHFDVYRIGDVEEMEEIGLRRLFLRKRGLPHRVG